MVAGAGYMALSKIDKTLRIFPRHCTELTNKKNFMFPDDNTRKHAYLPTRLIGEAWLRRFDVSTK